MTPERLRELRASLVGQTDRDKALELLAEVEGMRVEIDRLRALPVIQKCGRCPAVRQNDDGWSECHSFIGIGGFRQVDEGAPPPSWCPLRGGAR